LTNICRHSASSLALLKSSDRDMRYSPDRFDTQSNSIDTVSAHI
jgi:hypothetical protein